MMTCRRAPRSHVQSLGKQVCLIISLLLCLVVVRSVIVLDLKLEQLSLGSFCTFPRNEQLAMLDEADFDVACCEVANPIP